MSDLKKSIAALCDILQQADEPKLLAEARFLRQRACRPDSYVVLLGESCSGKSTIINSLLDEPVLPVSGVPSTGAVTEVFVDPEAESNVYALILKNATQALVDLNGFQAQALHPDPDVRRLRLTVPQAVAALPGVRVFDTPGYGSLVAEHEEVLLDFLPDCDAIIYTVSYRQGVQRSDHAFFRTMMDLIRPDIPVHLIINRCLPSAAPQDRRVREIVEHIKAFLDRPCLTVTLLPSIVTEDEEEVLRFPQAADFWGGISEELFSADRLADLEAVLQKQLTSLTERTRAILESRIGALSATAEQMQVAQEGLKKLAELYDAAVDGVIRPGFDDIRSRLALVIHPCAKKIENRLLDVIDQQETASKDETIAYVQNHLLPFEGYEQGLVLQDFVRIELKTLYKRLDDFLDRGVKAYEHDIFLHYSAVEKSVENTARQLLTKELNAAMFRSFSRFGGAGGAGAGSANFASHALKVIGDKFNHTFSRETHNALKHLMSKIGLTSTRNLTMGMAGLIELASVAYDYGTWKNKLRQKVRKNVAKWETDMQTDISKDLSVVEADDILRLHERANDFRCDAEQFAARRNTDDLERLQGLLTALDQI